MKLFYLVSLFSLLAITTVEGKTKNKKKVNQVPCTKTKTVTVDGTSVEISVTADNCTKARRGLREAVKIIQE
ncbi:MAG: hypothetical protein IE931_15055 [Sphingobacteriales bacterium]|nr:hypothetical protein [Sphingobacteriales bacterium]